MNQRWFIFFIFLSFFQVSAQQKEEDSIARKKIQAIKIQKSPKIDGVLDEEVWKNAAIATNFFERAPNNGKPQHDSLKTEVKVLYDHTGIYIGAQLNDPNPSKILKELTERDKIGNDDLFGVSINGYNDKQMSLSFFVTAAGVQYDAKIANNANDDSSWNAVWFSAVKINDKGWAIEMKIPFSELRFPKKEVQEWGINFIRNFRRSRITYDWNLVNNKKGSYTLYDGILQGIEKIEPPVRLSFLPYFSSYVNNFDGKTTTNINGGMDVKYGINEAFTLDLTLIPDFGQANFDKSVLNLSPFEQQFTEQRPFFTEGTELFNKGELFYSRRIGGEPVFSPNTNDNEEVVESPAKVKLFNAIKVSGRTSKGLGIGIFNAITEKTNATIRNTETGETRQEVIDPTSNYNVLVLDQRFNDNSSVSLVNTNVMRNGTFRDANVTGLYWDITNKKNTYNYFGNVEGSWIIDGKTKFGSEVLGGFAKVSGKHRLQSNIYLRTKDYNINDLGYTGKTNFINFYGYYGYRYLQPKGNLNNMFLNFNLSHQRRLETDLFGYVNFNFNSSFTNTKFQSFGGGVELSLFGENDFYEPRTFGRYLQVPMYFNPWVWYSSDFRKKLAFSSTLDYYAYDEKGRNKIVLDFYPRYRFSDRFSLEIGSQATFSNRETGFVGKDNGDVFIGTRNRYTVDSSITSKYAFNEKMTLNLSFRHYYSEVDYKNYNLLNQDGTLSKTSDFTENKNATYNTWNIDVRYSWWFAPGSELTLLYRNAIESYIEESKFSFKNNFNNLFKEPMVNNFSLKLTYYINYNNAKNWLKKKS